MLSTALNALEPRNLTVFNAFQQIDGFKEVFAR